MHGRHSSQHPPLPSTSSDPLTDASAAASSTPPTSPGLHDTESKLNMSVTTSSCTRIRGPCLTSLNSSQASSKTTGKANDIRSFFAPASPIKRRRRSSPSPLGNDENSKLSIPATSVRASSSSTTIETLGQLRSSSASAPACSNIKKRKKAPVAPKLEQLYLDPFETAGHSTLSCSVCSLSYSRTPDDMTFHDKHHKRVVGGCEWVTINLENKLVKQGKIQVIDSAVSCGETGKGRVIMVDAAPGGALQRKVADVLSTVDAQLSASALTTEQLESSKVFLFVTTQRRVVACAVVQRITSAYEVEPDVAAFDNKEGDTSSLVRFGDQGDEGAISCNPRAVPTTLGVQRVWTTSTFRRYGLATRLLDAAALHTIYGCSIERARRRLDVAFSQPTGKGQALAKAWTGSDRFRVFAE
ncbi:hypothetical protein OIO90_001076 [Microbotryomycetes sp. JL221]|nr:hypothetical protein OIO90_001076 [Microbotryomycetes sp. JL221]